MIVPFLDFQNNADSGINFHLVSKTITQEYTPKWIPRNISRVPVLSCQIYRLPISTGAEFRSFPMAMTECRDSFVQSLGGGLF